MLRAILTLLLVGCLTLSATGAEPRPAAKLPAQIMISLRFCEGQPDGNVEDGTLKILSSPSVIAIDGQQAHVTVGGEKELDGRKGEGVTHGVDCQITPKLLKNDSVLLKLRYECTELVDAERKDSVTAQGTCIRSSMVIQPGKTIRLGGENRDGDKVWLEATVEILRPGDVLTMAAPRR